MMSREEQGALMRENRNLVLSSPLDSLQDLGCCRLDLDHYLQHQEEFHQIPEDVVHQMVLLDPRLRSPQYFPLLARPGLRSLLIPCFPRPGEFSLWSSQQVNQAMDLVQKRCAGSLEKFGLCQFEGSDFRECSCHPLDGNWEAGVNPKPDLARLHAVLREQPNLRELRLGCDVTSETLSTLADTCHQLRSLTFEDCPDVDVNVTRQLVEGCPLLQKFDTKISKPDILNYAVKNLSHLTVVYPFLDITAGFRTFLESGGTVPSEHLWPSVEFTPNMAELPLIHGHFPKLYTVNIQAENLHQCHFKSVRRLRVDFIRPEHTGDLYAFLERCGSEIKELSLVGRSEDYLDYGTIDLSKIFKLCPNLASLGVIDLCCSEKCELEVTQESVKNLRCFVLFRVLEVTMTEYTPPDSVLYPVICNGVLEHFQVPTVNPQLLTRLTRETRAAVLDSRPSPVFPRLTFMEVDKVQQEEEDLTPEQAISLASLAPRVRDVRFLELLEQDKQLLREFLEEFRGPNQVQLVDS